MQTEKVETAIQEKVAETAAAEVKGVDAKGAGRGKRRRSSVPATPLSCPLAAYIKKVKKE